MSIFEDRERAIESEWARRAERETRLRARRNRIFAEWAAAQAGLTGPEATERARAYAKLDFDPRGEATMLERVAEDLGRTVDTLRSELAACDRAARDDPPD